MPRKYKWIPLFGTLQTKGPSLVWGPHEPPAAGATTPGHLGNFLCDQLFGGGHISARVTFQKPTIQDSCAFILFHHPTSRNFLAAGLGWQGFAWVASFINQWQVHSFFGAPDKLESGREYQVDVFARGSEVAMQVDGVNVIRTQVPFGVPVGNTGLFFRGSAQVSVSGFEVKREPSKVFVVMQFTPPYNDLFKEVIHPVCKEFGLTAIRADDSHGPGVILADITRQINEASLVIAEITPSNPNVYYEVGYSHALRKDTILIAEEPTKLPFDVSPWRVLFYENSIAGKSKLEAGLRKHLEALKSRPWQQ
jgi:hypothetical protein